MTVRLAVDTVNDVGSTALEVGGECIGERQFSDRSHARLLLPSMCDLLEQQNLQFRDVDEILVADGPGSFTGIRIGFATVVGLTSTLAPDVFVTSSMLSTAMDASVGTGVVAVCYEALRGDLYLAIYSRTDYGLGIVHAPRVVQLQRLPEIVEEDATVVLAEGAARHQIVLENMFDRVQLVRPKSMNLFAVRATDSPMVRVDDFAAWSPNYGRPAEAQARWERAHGRALSDTAG